MKWNKNARRFSAATRYTCCAATYYMPGLDKSDIVRMTAAVVDLKTDRLVAHREFWSDVDDIDGAAEDALDLAERCGAELFVLSEAVPLERCVCGCEEYLVRAIHRSDLAAIRHHEVCLARRVR